MTEPPADPRLRTALLDVNVLLALVWDQHVHHRAAHRHFASVASSWATTAVTETGVVRLLLTRVVVGRDVTAHEAIGVVRGLRASAGWRWFVDDASPADAMIDMRVLAGRRQVTDLHLVDLAARHDATLVTFDAGIPPALAPADRDHVVVWAD